MAARSFWKGTLSFGLLNIPVGLHTAEEGEEIHFTQLDPRNMARIRYRRVNEKTGKEVPYSKIAKGFEFAKNEFVIVTDKDIKAANPRATQSIDIEDFVRLEEIDPLFLEKSYYIVPEKGGIKGYLLLRDALAKEGKVAVGKVVLHTRQHLVAVMARGKYLVLEQLRFAHEILAEDEVHFLEGREAHASYSARELKMAQTLIKEMTKKWNPEKYKDTYYRDLMTRIKALVKAGKGATIESTARTAAPEP
ncbi:MAG: non-homologous end joining protein Ku, partial [Bdellovibrionota bacterium]